MPRIQDVNSECLAHLEPTQEIPQLVARKARVDLNLTSYAPRDKEESRFIYKFPAADWQANQNEILYADVWESPFDAFVVRMPTAIARFNVPEWEQIFDLYPCYEKNEKPSGMFFSDLPDPSTTNDMSIKTVFLIPEPGYPIDPTINENACIRSLTEAQLVSISYHLIKALLLIHLDCGQGPNLIATLDGKITNGWDLRVVSHTYRDLKTEEEILKTTCFADFSKVVYREDFDEDWKLVAAQTADLHALAVILQNLIRQRDDVEWCKSKWVVELNDLSDRAREDVTILDLYPRIKDLYCEMFELPAPFDHFDPTSPLQNR